MEEKKRQPEADERPCYALGLGRAQGAAVGVPLLEVAGTLEPLRTPGGHLVRWAPSLEKESLARPRLTRRLALMDAAAREKEADLRSTPERHVSFAVYGNKDIYLGTTLTDTPEY